MKNNDTPSIERLKELLPKATPPWEVRSYGLNFDICMPVQPRERGVAVVATVFSGEEVANLIVEAINALPHLIATLETLTPSPPLEQPDIEGRAREMLAEAMGLSDAAFARKVRYNAGMARCGVTNALRAIVKALACPPSRPSFDKWDFAAAVLKDNEGCGR